MAAPESLRHFSGLAVDLLAMGLLTVWCTTERRLALATTAFALTAIGVLAVAFLSAETEYNLKLHLPSLAGRITLPIEGTVSGQVNPNATAGAAVLVIPVVVALATLPRRPWRLLWGMRLSGSVAAIVASSLIVVMACRSAWFAAAIALCVVLARQIPGRRVRLALTVAALASVLLGATALFRWHPSSDIRAHALPWINRITWIDTYTTFATRTDVWHEACRRIGQSPILGIGINAFHEAHIGSPLDLVVPLAHAHNILFQVALDLGLAGLLVYIALMAAFWRRVVQASRGPSSIARRIALGSGFALLTVHLFGVADAIALGAKVGLFQWAAAGLVLAAWHIQQQVEREPVPALGGPGIGL
jgi:putative inorganic carbon (HCO3(-)) transporter